MKSKVHYQLPFPFLSLVAECENCGKWMVTMRFERAADGALRFGGLLAEYAACPFCGAARGEKHADSVAG